MPFFFQQSKAEVPPRENCTFRLTLTGTRALLTFPFQSSICRATNSSRSQDIVGAYQTPSSLFLFHRSPPPASVSCPKFRLCCRQAVGCWAELSWDLPESTANQLLSGWTLRDEDRCVCYRVIPASSRLPLIHPVCVTPQQSTRCLSSDPSPNPLYVPDS